MLGKSPDQSQKDLFRPSLAEIINPSHELVILAKAIDWKWLENEFAALYSTTGLPSKPVRLMAGLLILKQMYNLSDEAVISAWIQNPYYQFFCGEPCFQWQQPCDPSDLVHFRKRIGSEGAEKILQLSLGGHRKDIAKARVVLVDTTVQEKNITYPVDSKHYIKIIDKCNSMAKEHGVELRQSYTRIKKALLLKLRFSNHPARKKEAGKALKKLKTIAGRQVRDLERKLPEVLLKLEQPLIERLKKLLTQTRFDKDKIYSLHEPDVWCIAKGKSHKKYEFGTKTSVSALAGSNVVVGVTCFKGNPNDGKTLKQALEQVKKITEKNFKTAATDRGYRGHDKIENTEIVVAGAKRPKDKGQKQRLRKISRSRAAIEPIIGHLKTDCRMARNYLKGYAGDQINAILAGAALNFRLWLRKIRENGSFLSKIYIYIKLIFNTPFIFQTKKWSC